MEGEQLKARIYRLFYVDHLPASEIDKLAGLVKGDAARVIAHSWQEPTDYVQILIGEDKHGTDH